MADKDVEMLFEEFRKHFKALLPRLTEVTSRPGAWSDSVISTENP